jgi:hypothetical protein
MPELEVGSPEWWRGKLLARLQARGKDLKRYREYYEGKHRINPFATAKYNEVFERLFGDLSDNWCAPPVQAAAERLRIDGIRFGEESEYDKDAWAIWQRNELDAQSAVHHTSTLATGYGYMMVQGGEGESPVITIEDPEQTIVAYEPGTRTRAAALKRWTDEWTGRLNVNLYLPDETYKWQSASSGWTTGLSIGSWKEREPRLENPFGIVPLVEFANDPTIRGEGRSEIRRVIPLNDAVNQLLSNMLLAAEFSAFRQRWLTGVEIPVDPDTGQPIEAFKAAMDRLWSVEDPDAKFGEFSETNLENYVKAIEMLVQHIAAQTRTPRHYFWQAGTSPSGDAIKSAETGLVAKVKERQVLFGERYEEVIRLAFTFSGDSRGDVIDAEIRWADPEYRTEGELTDAVIKQYQAGLITWDTALGRLGYTPQEIERMRTERMRDTLIRGGANIVDLFEGTNEPAA